jgi:glutamine synthetase type III
VIHKAESWARDAVEHEPAAADLRVTLAAILSITGQTVEALKEVKNVLVNEELVERRQNLISALLVICGAAGHVSESLSILSSSPAAVKLEPLLTALQILHGQTPNAPLEVLEVAKDIVKQIETLRASMSTTTTAPHPKKPTTKKPKTKARR